MLRYPADATRPSCSTAPAGTARRRLSSWRTQCALFGRGTAYSALARLALAVATDSQLSRLVQLADVVTSCTASIVGGERRFAPKVFEAGVLPLLRRDYGCVGGRGLKLHPDYRYRNLYHWLLG